MHAEESGHLCVGQFPVPPERHQTAREGCGWRGHFESEESSQLESQGPGRLHPIPLPVRDAPLADAEPISHLPLADAEVEPSPPEVVAEGVRPLGIARRLGLPSPQGDMAKGQRLGAGLPQSIDPRCGMQTAATRSRLAHVARPPRFQVPDAFSIALPP